MNKQKTNRAKQYNQAIKQKIDFREFKEDNNLSFKYLQALTQSFFFHFKRKKTR